MSINFFKIPYSDKMLEPFISSETISFHYDKHHKTYYNNLIQILEDFDELKDASLEEIILHSYNKKDLQSLYNNSAQVFNHDFYWNSLSLNAKISDFVLNKINENFESIDNFKEILKDKALKQFGSGWVWLVLNKNDKLEIISTPNADNPLILGLVPLLTIDVWEHAYYIDYRNKRAEYLDNIISNLINWDFVEININKIKTNKKNSKRAFFWRRSL